VLESERATGSPWDVAGGRLGGGPPPPMLFPMLAMVEGGAPMAVPAT